jgi:hypothetical protein
MTDKLQLSIKITTLAILISGLLVACSLPGYRDSSVGEDSGTLGARAGTYPVDPIFQEFYAYLGGGEVLGPAISPVHEEGGLRRQYVESGLMVYDPQATPSDRYRLAPLGKGFDLAEPRVPEPASTQGRYVAGHVIDPSFLPLYESLGGARFVGRPITEARHNPGKLRVEQHFENLGFYRLVDEPAGGAHLLAYGVLACDRSCRYSAQSAGIPELRPPLPEPFISQESILGLSFVGLTLSEPYEAPDGKLEVIFENIVLAAEPGAASSVIARPIVTLVGIEPQAMGSCQPQALSVCLPGEAGRGHMVPQLFEDYIQRHGGWALSGMPITEVYPLEVRVYRQCYNNLCLDFDLDAPDSERLQPVPLGETYKELYYDRLRRGQFEEDFQDVHVLIWEQQPTVASGQPQEIGVTLTEAEIPLVNREPILNLTLPDNRLESYRFPPTDEGGKTVLQIPGVEAPNGTLIPYEVCLVGVYGKTFCVGENYLIWNLP